MALIPIPGTKKRFDPPLVVYTLAQGEDPSNPEAVHIRRTIFYSAVYLNQERGIDETSLSSAWTDEQIEKGLHLPFIDVEDCPAGREEERLQRMREFDAMSVSEKLQHARSLANRSV